ncbi:MAG TPA: hypothetical protein VJN50_05015 [Actinomycetota bacterium]|nr:hypothetical protein [Actinomycetota bacterium]
MRYAELTIATLLALGGVRALLGSLRERFEAADVGDHLLYALYVTGHVGIWFGFAGLFAIVASIHVEGRALIDEFRRYRWYFMVPLVLGAMQFVGGQLLARRSPR